MSDSPEPSHPPRINRRDAIRWMMAASASLALTRVPLHADLKSDNGQGGKPNFPEDPAAPTHQRTAMGYGGDVDLTKTYKPGDFWPLTFTEQQRRTATALCAIIIPGDDQSPSAVQVGVPDFIDEWISAPYPAQQQDRPIILKGLEWIDSEAKKRFNKVFADLDDKQSASICDEICSKERASFLHGDAANFFSIFRNLTAGGFYTTPEGMKDLQYIGNIPLVTFDGPPIEALRKVGLA